MASFLNKSDVFWNNSEMLLVSDADYAAVELFKGYPEGLLKFASVCCFLFMIIGIPGNIISIAALARYKRVHNATAIFIMNLSFSDLLFCCITPSLTGVTFWKRAWTHGRHLCHIHPPIRYTLIAVSIFTILAITINRYIIIIYPRIYRRTYQTRNLVIMLLAIWIAPLLILIPTFLGKWGRFDLDATNGSCTIVPDQNGRSSKKFLFLASFVVPCVPIFFCYGRIFLIVRKATEKSKSDAKSSSHQTSSNRENTSGDSSSITIRNTALGDDSNDEIKENDNDIPLKHNTSNIKNFKANFESSTALSSDETELSVDKVILEPSGPPKIRRNVFQRSMAMIKITLPSRKDQRLGTMIFAIMVSFCLCHFPIILTKVLRWVTPHPVVEIVAHILLYFSSCINPVVYIVMSKEYQKAYRNLFNRRKKATLLINDANK